ncbi:MAG: T9SS type A sorting domain-containing protein [Bacteroidia bacterium]
MKKGCFLIILFFSCIICDGQNLVPNGDFEGYSGCPTFYSQLDSALYWFNPTGATPDYYNQCAFPLSWVDVPDNLLGYQFANSGKGYAGIFLFEMLGLGGDNWREYIEIPFSSPLITNNCYHFEMYVNLANTSNYATSDLGVYFSPLPLTNFSTSGPLAVNPQVTNSTGYITDTLNWILVSANYTATGGENYLIVGNFKDDILIDTLLLNYDSTYSRSYIFIDDVSLTPCTGISEQNQTETITIYPNPVKDELTISGLPGEKEIVIKDILGKEIYRNQFSNSTIQLPTSNFQKGIYFIEINTGTKVIRKKFVKE